MLILGFFAIAFLYSMVGFGGGSSYIALLALSDTPYQLIPIVALICNILVVTGGAFHFYRRGHFNPRLFAIFAVTSIPMAYVGGRVPVSERTFMVALSFCLFLVGFRLLIWDRIKGIRSRVSEPKLFLGLGIGGGLGLLSGLVGIGGGIFLAPILHWLGWGKSKEIAATATFFILLNSITGLCGQIVKSGEGGINQNLSDFIEYVPLFVAVVLGGQIGSRLGAGERVSNFFIKDATAYLVLFVAARILISA